MSGGVPLVERVLCQQRDECVDHGRVELCAGHRPDLVHGCLSGQRLSVRAVIGHRVERVDDCEDPGHEGDLLAAQPVRIGPAPGRRFAEQFRATQPGGILLSYGAVYAAQSAETLLAARSRTRTAAGLP
jgi:hypothetical protein